VLSHLVLRYLRRAEKSTTYFDKLGGAVRFLLFFVWEMVKSNIRVAHDVVTPTYYMRPGIVAIPLEARTDFEVLVLANLITLTPGTLSLDVSDDRKFLYVHAMFLDDRDGFKKELKDGMERRLLEVLR
jgi:multicomponent Na+:H+ antiporter subunit E